MIPLEQVRMPGCGSHVPGRVLEILDNKEMTYNEIFNTLNFSEHTLRLWLVRMCECGLLQQRRYFARDARIIYYRRAQ
jgi:predicted transcriptional regulator